MIVTFYSYKGGTGRTMALANIAALLAQRGKRVLAVDFDLEAPGLWRYFTRFDGQLDERQGLIDMFAVAASAEDSSRIDWRDYVTEVSLRPGALSLLTSGKQDDKYPAKVLGFDWADFFKNARGGEYIEHLRLEWKAKYDFTLIDSRTGVTDSGGICTIMLPDLIVPVLVSNWQSLEGVVDVIQRAQAGRARLGYDRSPATILPILSRFDSRTEYASAQEWLDIAADRLAPFYDDWLPARFSPRDALERTKLPYVAYFSFGETLPVLTERTSDPESLSYALSAVTQLIQGELGNADAVMEHSATQAVGAWPELATMPRAEDPGLDELNVMMLGTAGSGKTVYLASLYRHFDIGSASGIRFRADKASAVVMQGTWEQLAGGQLPVATFGASPWRFTVRAQTASGDYADAFTINYLYYDGERILRHSRELGGSHRAENPLDPVSEAMLDKCDVLMGILDGAKIINILRGEPDRSYMVQLDRMLGMLADADNKVVQLVLTKYDLLVSQNITIGKVIDKLDQFQSFWQFRHFPRASAIRLIPVAALSRTGFVSTSATGASQPNIQAGWRPDNVDVPIMCALTDLLDSELAKLQRASQKSTPGQASQRWEDYSGMLRWILTEMGFDVPAAAPMVLTSPIVEVADRLNELLTRKGSRRSGRALPWRRQRPAIDAGATAQALERVIVKWANGVREFEAREPETILQRGTDPAA